MPRSKLIAHDAPARPRQAVGKKTYHANSGPSSKPARTAAVKGYQGIAKFYDDFFSPFHVPLDKARAKVLGPILRRVRTVCDLGSGTGTTALSLASTGIKVYAVDLSPGMCGIARRKARQAQLPLHVLQADMRGFRLPETVDLIVCEGDALNHIPKSSDLRRVVESAFRALCPGGYFFFDVNNRLGFQRYWNGAVCLETPGVFMVMRNAHSRDGQRAISDIDCFVREGRLWRRHYERVEEVCWTAQEIRRILSETGFDAVRAWDASPFFGAKSIVTPGCRTVYLAHRPDGKGRAG